MKGEYNLHDSRTLQLYSLQELKGIFIEEMQVNLKS